MSNIISGMSMDEAIRAFFLDSTEIVAHAQKIHNCSNTVTAALGRALTGAAVMGSTLKGEEDNITISFCGGGPIGKLVCVANSCGFVKGYATNPFVELPLRKDGKPDVGAAVGTNGDLSVVVDIGLKEPYVSRLPMISGEIAQELTSYYAKSEQIPTVFALGVALNKNSEVEHAGGLLISLLPGATESHIEMLEKRMETLPPITTMLKDGLDGASILFEALGDVKILGQKNAAYRCDCSRMRVEKALIALGKKELEDIILEDKGAHIDCHFCDESYDFNEQQLRDLLYSSSS